MVSRSKTLTHTGTNSSQIYFGDAYLRCLPSHLSHRKNATILYPSPVSYMKAAGLCPSPTESCLAKFHRLGAWFLIVRRTANGILRNMAAAIASNATLPTVQPKPGLLSWQMTRFEDSLLLCLICLPVNFCLVRYRWSVVGRQAIVTTTMFYRCAMGTGIEK